MPYSLSWEPRGVCRRFHGDVSIAERLASFEAICRDPRFDELRHTLTDYRAVESYEVSAAATREIAAFHLAPQPYELFAAEGPARRWLAPHAVAAWPERV